MPRLGSHLISGTRLQMSRKNPNSPVICLNTANYVGVQLKEHTVKQAGLLTVLHNQTFRRRQDPKRLAALHRYIDLLTQLQQQG